MKKNVAKKSNKKSNKKGLWIFFGAVVLSFSLFVAGALYTSLQPDKQCLVTHQTTTTPPKHLTNAQDYFNLANYNFDRGDCNQAIVNYTLAIKKDPKFDQAYNNRAYTYMRMQDYDAALSDLNKALTLRPTYVHALMNRGDIYNFYKKDQMKALADYNTVINLVSPDKYRSLSLCGHKLLAENNGWHLGVL